MTNTIYILLGANLGNPIQQIDDATHLLNKSIGKITNASSIYQTEAWGVEDQPLFFNQVLTLETTLSPHDCLKMCQKIENDLGRIREKKWGSRIIDIDILYYDNIVLNTTDLIIPHPFIHLRNFTLTPLNEIDPNYIHPVLNKSNQQLLLETTDELLVSKIQKRNGL